MYSYKSGCTFKTLQDIKGKNIVVMGLGLNGGGEACVRFFLRHGANVLATDMKTAEQLAPTIQKLSSDPELDTSRLFYRLGEHKLEDFQNADCVIKNPGVKIEGNKYLAAAKNIETDISIFLHFTKAPVIAVTGSKGKSSTVSAISYGLNNAGFTAFLGGNITVSPLTFLEKTTEKTPVVLELSSWQLADLRGRKALKPKICIITKIVPDHQNWYHAMEPYVADKRLIYADQTSSDYSIFDFEGDEPGTGPECGGTWGDFFAKETKGNAIRYFKKNEKLSFRTDNAKPVNKLIIGDNYQALQNLLIQYRDKIDVIYIDPPYGKDSMGEFAKTNYNNAITRDNLLSMLYPRLVLARQLLSDEGVIFCSIDDKNQAYVKCLFDEIFGEENFVGNIDWESKTKSQNTESAFQKLQPKCEYILCYGSEGTKHKFNLISVGQKDYNLKVI